MFDIGGGELILIVLAILLLFGPKKIPEIAQMIGKGMQKLKQAQSQFQDQVNEIKKEMDVDIDLNLGKNPLNSFKPKVNISPKDDPYNIKEDFNEYKKIHDDLAIEKDENKEDQDDKIKEASPSDEPEKEVEITSTKRNTPSDEKADSPAG